MADVNASGGAVALDEERMPAARPIARTDVAPIGVERARGEPVVVAQDVVKRYGDCEALRGVSLTVRRGEVFGLLGPNGAGKTTLVEILEGVRPLTSGHARVLGMSPTTDMRALRDRIGVSLQHTMLPRYLKVGEAIALFGCMYERRRMSPKELLERFQLTEKQNAYYGDLSGGQRQRLALALAVQHDPDLLVFDEPSAGLDAQARLDIQDFILELRDERKSILLTTHYIEEAERLCDRVAIIDHGTIVAEGAPGDVCKSSTLPSRVSIKASAPPPADLVRRLADVNVRVEQSGTLLTIDTSDAGRCVLEISSWLLASGERIDSIEVTNPTLESVFLGLTGRAASEAEDNGKPEAEGR